LPEAASHPILRGVPGGELVVRSWLYKVSPLAKAATPLMMGRVEGREPPEPVAWTHTHRGGRVFYTSLGHPDDFKLPAFQTLLKNSIDWAATTQ
jgi:type 1 glutamine amidotransferase